MFFLQLLISTYFLSLPIQAHATYAGPPVVLTYIAQCESGQKQFNDDGTIVRSKTKDVGLYQINLLHKKTADSMGYDIFTAEGNTAYAIYLYNKEGTRPWNASKKCWQKLAERDS